MPWYWLFAASSGAMTPSTSIPRGNRPRNFDRTRSTAHFSSSASSCSYSAKRYSYSIRRGSGRTFCNQQSSLRRVAFITVARIRVRVRVPAYGLSTSTIGIKESNARTEANTRHSREIFHFKNAHSRAWLWLWPIVVVKVFEPRLRLFGGIRSRIPNDKHFSIFSNNRHTKCILDLQFECFKF